MAHRAKRWPAAVESHTSTRLQLLPGARSLPGRHDQWPHQPRHRDLQQDYHCSR